MIINRTIAVKPLENGDSAKRTLERFYIQNCFETHLDSISQREEFDSSYPNFKYHIKSQVIEYTDGLFTLPQLYCICRASLFELGSWGYDYTVLDDFKTDAINYINRVAEDEDEAEMDLGDIENFKKNLLELNPIILTILNNLFHESFMFDDEGYRYPKISNDENECLSELEELVWTYNALERIGVVCKKFYKIDNRVAALTSDGYEISNCWVGSGGVGSTFYMYNKKEIRIQVAASKFKGNGNNKSKSALCVVIPYPTFLRKNRIRHYD